MAPSRSPAAGYDVNDYLGRFVPITRAMGVRFRSFDDAGVVISAPLAPNINDKGIAFGGTLASLLFLSGWALEAFIEGGGGKAAAFHGLYVAMRKKIP